MHLSHRQEAFSRAYVRAVAAVVGLRAQDGPEPDDDSVDMTLAARGPGNTVRSPRLDLQLKCQLGPPNHGEDWAYDLKLKNYDDLRPTDVQVPRILVIVAVPEVVEDWIEHGSDHMMLRHSAWWLSLRGLPDTQNTSTVRVRIPWHQRFDVASLTAIMHVLADGGQL
jgi:hypothetical protein